ncbi:thioredoxin [Treponema sp. TIM-1]|uniref:thioredoxin n=1 Tax=Treponema sp. TIM-1 TaxID=2898417 RepID=UPI00397EB7A4
MSKGVQITAANFEGEVLQSPIPVLVDFWAAWCTPCKMISPLLDQLGENYEGRLKVGKVNVDEENDLAVRHNVVSIPTLVVYKAGQIVRQQAGALPKHELENLVKDLV